MALKAAKAPPAPARIPDECNSQYSASLKCLEKNINNKSKCEKQLDIYKECKKRENGNELEQKLVLVDAKPMRVNHRIQCGTEREARLARNKAAG